MTDRKSSISLIAVVAMIAAWPASAQETGPDPSSAADRQRSGAPGNSAGSITEVPDIIVTAQRREERNQDVPIAITAFSGERLQQQNVRTGQDLNGVVPSLQVSPSAQASREVEAFILRGQAVSFQGAPSVVVYLNEVPLPQGVSINQQGGPGNYVDLENVQVLAGPQGTLFGRNTTGGAALLVPRKPTNDLGGYVQASVGNYDYRGVEAVLNIPVIRDKLLVRVSGTYQDRDGYTRDVVWNKDRDNLHYYAGRIGITLKPTERIENYLMIYGASSRNNGIGYIHKAFNIGALQAIGYCADPPAAPGPLGVPCDVYRRQSDIANQLGPRKTRYDLDEFDETRTWGVINTTSFDMTDELTLRNIFSYQRYKKDYVYDADATPLQQADAGSNKFPDFPVPGLTDEFGLPAFGYLNAVQAGPRDNIRQITEELQLQGRMLDNHLTFTIGGFYYGAKPVSTQLNRAVFFCPAAFTGLCAPTVQLYSVTTTSKALYGQGTLDLGVLSPSLSSLRLTAGYRYTWDRINGSTIFYLPDNPVPGSVLCIDTGTPATDPNDCGFGAMLKSKAPTWTLGLDYKPASNLLVFAKASRGFKAGGFNAYSVRPETQTFEPEKVTSYEAGFKSDWRVGAVPFRLNATAFVLDYANIQRANNDTTGAASGARYDPASARIKGIETEATLRPVRMLELGGNVSLTDAYFKDFRYTAIVPVVACNGAVPAGGIADGSCTSFGVSKWIYNIHASLDLPLPESLGSLNLYANYSHRSKQDTSAPSLTGQQPGAVLPAYGLLNLSINWKNIGRSGLDANVFMTNATNKLYRVTNSNGFLAGGGYLAWTTAYGEPRMYGLRLRYNFGS
jgi:iron complex outermembrane recepter protein